MRAAQRVCPRCCWLQSQDKLKKKFVYVDASSGASVPWIAESTDPDAPWGLGCTVCKEARERGLCAEVSGTAFSEFTFGTDGSSVGLIVEALVRHGGHRKVGLYTCDGKTVVGDLHGYGHAAALSALRNTCESDESAIYVRQ
eukprot:gnl/TRDRNA2_/TRDRNA2_64055_c1_seq1.p1 gnl/TRDRNA2_/TRDRNA2_64055_c1~~gnl/TRDRNA2_/TRDRNA2_64055_c1_seq1.p1  ORF type:complete len:157 (-),score=25.11 gnl/TRDRNA2_/TRDRNA2_64055_c1_seq1:17-442(-)